MITAENLKEVNQHLSSVDVKGKAYVMVNTRVNAFRQICPKGSIVTDIVSLADGVVTMKATICDEDGQVLATGYAQEKETSSFINKTSFIENCETSAIGRALAFVGIGSDASIASAEEVANAIEQQKPKTITEDQVNEITSLCDGRTGWLPGCEKKIGKSLGSWTSDEAKAMIKALKEKVEKENK